MRFRELFEGRDAPLYHGTTLRNASSMLNANEIWARTSHAATALAGMGRAFRSQGNLVNGVSLTRDKAKGLDFGEVSFEIDQRRLAQTHRLIPFDYWSADKPKGASRRSLGNQHVDSFEFEEFCVGPIKNLDRYLFSVHISPKCYQVSLRTDNDWRTEMARKLVSDMIDRHLLVVDGKRMPHVPEKTLTPA